MSIVMSKANFRVCDQVRLKPASSADETSLGLEISAIATGGTCVLYYLGIEQQSRW